jgi:hypothetical protein
MPTLIVVIDEATEAGLRQMAQQRNVSTAEMASRLLAALSVQHRLKPFTMLRI